jgi:hypothetical protein
MAIEDDIAVDGSGNFYYTGAVHGAAGAGYYTVIEFHRYAQDLADDATASGDDLIDITSATPSDRSTDNFITILAGYQLDDANVSATEAISEHLYDGSIVQAGDGTIWDGQVVLASEGMDLQIIQNGAIVANDFWNSIPNGETLKGLNRDVVNGISHRFMLKVNNAGSEIDGRRYVGITREQGKTYSEFLVNGSARGNNVLALRYEDDLNNATAPATIATWSTITNTEGYRLIDIDGNGSTEPYYSEWNKATFTTNQLTERLKWLSACESGSTDATANGTLYGLDGNIFRGITHEIQGTQAAGTFVEPESVSWSGGTGQLLAIDSTTAATKMWIQLLTGVAPTSGTITGNGGATFTASGNTSQTVSAPFFGVSTGQAVIGAFGFALEFADTGTNDRYTDLNGTTNQPPNNVTYVIDGVVSGEDRILLGPRDAGSGLREDQCQVATGEAITVTAGAVSSAGSGAGVVVLASNTETIGTGTPSEKDTPTSGTIRVLDSNGIFQIVNYTGFTAGTGEIDFTGCTATGTWSAAAANNSFISYLDLLATSTSESVTVVYDSDRNMFIRVRDGGTAGDLAGIKTFETTGTLGTNGGTTTVIRTADE